MASQTQIIYSPDYRSPPSGLGTIDNGGVLTLIQDNGTCGSVRDGIYHDIIKLDTEVFEDMENNFPQLLQVLRDNGVTHVYDAETAGDFNIPEELMDIGEWIRLIAS